MAGTLKPDLLYGSFALSRRVNDGYGYNATLNKKVSDTDTTQFRGKLRLTPGGGWNAVLAVDGLIDQSDNNRVNFPTSAAPRTTYTPIDLDDFKRHSGGLSLKVEKALDDGLSFKSITSYRRWHDHPNTMEQGGLVQLTSGGVQNPSQKSAVQEFQLQGRQARLEWTAGLLLSQVTYDYHRTSWSRSTSTGVVSRNEGLSERETTDVGLYAQGRYALRDDTGLTLGGRLYKTRQEASSAYWTVNDGGARSALVYAFDGLSTKSDGFIPKIGVDHHLTPSVLVYGNVARGERFGGFADATGVQRSAQYPTTPEKVTSYEVGTKATALDGRLQGEVSLFYNDYDNYISSVRHVVIDGVTVNTTVAVNAGRARLYGLDYDLTARLTPNLDWRFSGEFLKTKFVDFLNPTGEASTNYAGNRLPNVAPGTLFTSLDWRQGIGGGTLNLNATVQYIRAYYTDVANTAATKTPDQTYVNLYAGYTTADGLWLWSLRVNNLLDKDYAVQRTVSTATGVDATAWNAPRTVVLGLRRYF
ncbi:TonB-dependent receptor [Xylophilus sp.]|uniref:TonB-dependent receptor n=1 Tax=Xylophilus sp. TaxID=2653893 RepID=UPI0013BB19B3|nr:TonB-dependent receptor [Xylophilus sp.]KAF1044921.1 MAG: Ferric-pseudobactin 358 receptor [Xylophilus sp.]